MTSDQPPVPGGSETEHVLVLDADEIAVGTAYSRLASIVERLVVTPFDQAAYREMQDYLAVYAWPALAAFERISRRNDHALSARIEELHAATSRALSENAKAVREEREEP